MLKLPPSTRSPVLVAFPRSISVSLSVSGFSLGWTSPLMGAGTASEGCDCVCDCDCDCVCDCDFDPITKFIPTSEARVRIVVTDEGDGQSAFLPESSGGEMDCTLLALLCVCSATVSLVTPASFTGSLTVSLGTEESTLSTSVLSACIFSFSFS